MKKDPLNHLLLEEFPYLEKHYQEVKGGIFDLDTPSHAFYEEIFLPYLLLMYKEENRMEVEHCCQFIEDLLCSDEEEKNSLAINGILCPLYDRKEVDMSLLPLKEKTKEYYLDWLKEGENIWTKSEPSR